MAGFDANSYFANKLQERNAFIKNKAQEVSDASAIKLQELGEIAAGNAEYKKRFDEANKDSWVNKLGLESDSGLGEIVNLGAATVSGGSRLVGHLMQLPDGMSLIGQGIAVSQEDLDAYTRHKQGMATEADKVLLAVKKSANPRMEMGRPDLQQALPTTMERIEKALANLQSMGETKDTFDLTGIQHKGNSWKLHNALGKAFDENSLDSVSGALGMAKDTVKALATNKLGVLETAVENAPQLGLGLLGPVGAGLMAASNVGYGMETLGDGARERIKKNNGQLPTKQEQGEMLRDSAIAAAMEQV